MTCGLLFGEVALEHITEMPLFHPSDIKSLDNSASQPASQPVIGSVSQPVSQSEPKPPGKSSLSFNQAEGAAAKEQLNIAHLIIKHSRGGTVSKEADPLLPTSAGQTAEGNINSNVNPAKTFTCLFTL